MSRHPHLPRFSGETYEAPLDGKRLSRQLDRVRDAMESKVSGEPGPWLTLDELALLTGERSTASLSARIRDLRQEKGGRRTVERQRRQSAGLTSGVWEYRLLPVEEATVVDAQGQGVLLEVVL